ncbi:MAG: hypothetical protein HYU66_28530, partial [Armatimonadetes bacterium]|nr:hypothetical protein [Armatimonadota bacterium]
PGTDTIVARSGDDLYQWNPRQPDLPPHLPLDAWTPDPQLAKDLRYQINSEGEVWTYDLRRTRVVESRRLDHPPVERALMALGVGPDGLIYGGAYQSYQLFRYDPRRDELTTLGSYDPTWSGEPYSFTTRGPELIIASYTNGHVAAYDPSKPWHCTAMERLNPRVLGFFGQQVYRPYSVAAATDERIWAVGPAGWGSTGAGVAWLDPATGTSHSTRLERTPSDILPLPGNQLLICDWDRLVWWDGTADRELAAAKVDVGIQGAVLLPGAPPRIAYVGGPVVVVASLPQPGQVKVELTSQGPIPGQHLQRYSRGVVIGGPQGFATCRLPEGTWRQLANVPLGLRYAFVCHDDVVYFHRGSALMALAIPPEG